MTEVAGHREALEGLVHVDRAAAVVECALLQLDGVRLEELEGVVLQRVVPGEECVKSEQRVDDGLGARPLHALDNLDVLRICGALHGAGDVRQLRTARV